MNTETWERGRMRKLMKGLGGLLVLSLLLGAGLAFAPKAEAQDAGLLFPFITTVPGQFTFIHISNDGAGGTLNPFVFPFATSVPRTYHFTYAHKAVPILNTAACDHFDGDALTTPFDKMFFEVSGPVKHVQTNPPSFALFESGVTSTPVTLPISGRQGFLIVELLAQDNRCLIAEGCIPTLPGAVVPVGGFPGVALTGGADIIDAANGLFYSYTTGFLAAGLQVVNTGAAGVPGLVDPQFAFIDESRHFLDWYPDSIVKTSWWVLPLGSRSEMAPFGGGGIRMALVTQPRGIGAASAFDLDEHVFSGGPATRVRCVGIVDRTNLLGSGAKLNTDGGGWTRTIGAVATIAAATDPNDIQGGTYTRRRHLMLTIQSAPTVLGTPITTIARTAHAGPLFGIAEIYFDSAPGDANGCKFTFPATQGIPCPDPANAGTGIVGDTIP